MAPNQSPIRVEDASSTRSNRSKVMTCVFVRPTGADSTLLLSRLSALLGSLSLLPVRPHLCISSQPRHQHRPPWVLNDVRLDYSFLVSLLLPDMDSAASLRIRRRARGVRDACLARAGVPGPEGERPRSMHGGMRMCRGAFRAQMRARVWVCALARMGSNRIVPRTSVMSEAATRGTARGGSCMCHAEACGRGGGVPVLWICSMRKLGQARREGGLA